ncbi:hypothetical protein OH76DRAFT_1406679 [Lentinus brumalis]|uniref:Uncharacterized protein n=1 Tax=Lentinus brumalis TaxID=2498619 RepID=A0A371D2T8_9APHY|nr:hypothetical protein OH76DRAFT_1406679 [Polyporus brumalis]
MPFCVSSMPPWTGLPPAVYTLVEDVLAVDGGGCVEFRQAWRTRYEHSAVMRRIVPVTSLCEHGLRRGIHRDRVDNVGRHRVRHLLGPPVNVGDGLRGIHGAVGCGSCTRSSASLEVHQLFNLHIDTSADEQIIEKQGWCKRCHLSCSCITRTSGIFMSV